MLLVLCSADDADALWFAVRARLAGADVAVVTDTRLAFARRRSHRVDEGGALRRPHDVPGPQVPLQAGGRVVVVQLAACQPVGEPAQPG